MEQTGDIEDTGNREHKKLGEAKPIWPRDQQKGNSVRSFAISIFDSFEYVLCWFYYLVGHVASFRILLQFSAVMLFAMGVYGVTIDMENVNLEGAELTVANFSDAHLAGAIVTSANGAYANFAGADLSHANFSDTELQGALFDDADIGGARLGQSYDLSNTQIEKACDPPKASPVLPEHLEWTERRC